MNSDSLEFAVPLGHTHLKIAMKLSSSNPSRFARTEGRHEQANARTTALVLGFFLLGVAASAFWFYRASGSHGGTGAGPDEGAGSGTLSDGTMAVLKRLDSPVEIRFYSLLDPASTSDSLRAFAERVNQLLSLYQQAANGQVKVIRSTSLADASQAAAADGLRSFNSDKGESCFLGISLVRGTHKEPLPLLSPEWESALQSDLSRAIARVIDAAAPARPVAARALNPAVFEEVKRKFPNLESVSVAEGERALREAAVNDMQASVAAMEPQLKEAEQRVAQAQTGGSEAEQQAAMKHLQEVQAEQTQKFKQISARATAQIEALKQLKAAPR
jgi:hypothetical protein